MKTVKIFFASSEELIDDRNAFGNMVRRLNKSYEKRGIHLELFEWEDHDASFGDIRKQDEYNKFVRESDVFLAVFHTDAGKFTVEEFEVALEEFRIRHLPKIYIYCKDLKEGETEQPGLKAFKDKLRNDMGHYWSRYTNRDTMHLHFLMQLQIIENDMESSLKIDEGKVVFDGQLVAKVENLPFAALNEDYVRMNSRLTELPTIIEKTRARIEKYPDDEEFKEQLQEQLKEYDKLKADFEEHQNNLFATARRVAQLQGERVTARMRRAMDALSEGKVKEANIILDEAERDGETALNDYNESVKTTELKRQNVISSIEEIRLKISALRSDLSIPVSELIPGLEKLFVQVDHMAKAVDYDVEKYIDFLDSYASFLSRYGLYSEELSKLFRALEMSKKHYGDEHSSVVLLYSRIGIAFMKLSDNDTARQYFSLALTIEERNNREENLANLYNNLASVYHSLGNQDDAFFCLKKGLDLARKTYGSFNPYIARLYETMSSVCCDLKQYEEALEFSTHSLEIHEHYFGAESIESATMRNNVALLQDILGRTDEALENLLKSCELRKKLLGENHPDTANSYYNLASLYLTLSEYETALDYSLKAYTIAESKSESRQSEFHANRLLQLASIYYKLGRADEALEYYLKLLPVYESNPKTELSDLVVAINNIAFIYFSRKDYDKALEYYMKSLDMCKESNYNDMAVLANIYDNLGQLYYATARYEDALANFTDALEYRKASVDKNHPGLATIFNNLGCSYEALGQYDKALDKHLRAYEIRKAAFGEDSDATLMSCNNVAYEYKFLGQYDEALEYMLKVLDVRTRMKGKFSYDCFKSYKNIASMYELMGESEKALDSYRKALEIIRELDPESKQYEEIFSKVQQYDQ